MPIQKNINKDKINKILILIIDMTDQELGLLINQLRMEQSKRSKGRNLDTVFT